MVDLQVSNLFFSMSVQDAILKITGLIICRNLINNPYKEIRLAIKNYISPKDRVVTAEMSNFPSVTQVVGELDVVTEVNESLQLRSQAMAFASSSSVNKTFTVK